MYKIFNLGRIDIVLLIIWRVYYNSTGNVFHDEYLYYTSTERVRHIRLVRYLINNYFYQRCIIHNIYTYLNLLISLCRRVLVILKVDLKHFNATLHAVTCSQNRNSCLQWFGRQSKQSTVARQIFIICLYRYTREYADMESQSVNRKYLLLSNIDYFGSNKRRMLFKSIDTHVAEADGFYGNSTLYILWVVFDVYRCNNCMAYIRKRWVLVEEFHISIRVGLE